MRSQTDGLTVGQALALGALHGPAELLPVSSSAHASAIPWLLGWRYSELDPELRKSFEVALHAGATIAVVIGLRGELAQTLRELDRHRLWALTLSAMPPAIAGIAFERQVERRLGTPATIATALLGGAAVMLVAERFPQERRSRQAGPRDGLWLGVAQACALVPGVSRAGATLSAARFLRFRAHDAQLLSDEAALPVLAGAALLKATQLRRRGLEPRHARMFAAGAGAAFASTVAFATALRRGGRARRLWPYALYRSLLAGLIFSRLGRGAHSSAPGTGSARRLGSDAHDQGHTGSV